MLNCVIRPALAPLYIGRIKRIKLLISFSVGGARGLMPHPIRERRIGPPSPLPLGGTWSSPCRTDNEGSPDRRETACDAQLYVKSQNYCGSMYSSERARAQDDRARTMVAAHIKRKATKPDDESWTHVTLTNGRRRDDILEHRREIVSRRGVREIINP